MKELVSSFRTEKEKWTFPCLGIASNEIVLFINMKEGTVIHSITENRPLGAFVTDWFIDAFEPFNGPVVLEMK